MVQAAWRELVRVGKGAALTPRGEVGPFSQQIETNLEPRSPRRWADKLSYPIFEPRRRWRATWLWSRHVRPFNTLCSVSFFWASLAGLKRRGAHGYNAQGGDYYPEVTRKGGRIGVRARGGGGSGSIIYSLDRGAIASER